MKHVFVETNWIVDAFGPPYARSDEALRLLARAEAGDLVLHVPAVAVREGEHAIRSRYVPRIPREIRAFRRIDSALNNRDDAVIEGFFQRFVTSVEENARALSAALEALRSAPGVDVFGMGEAALARVLALRAALPGLRLKPFDEAILASVLEHSASSRRPDDQVFFCTLDADLNPRRKDQSVHVELQRAYDDAGITLRTDFGAP